ncbi:hypothetical protein BDZ91DRAFT_168767 [Kalaharituber pfeilii]|nr:hypothetical protein BDZ91DRAFT_168767 [Kalaharituber pfeilii]
MAAQGYSGNSFVSGIKPLRPEAYPEHCSSSETHANGQETISGIIRIAVMGVTGAGKSTFIQTITGDQRITIGHNLESCTQDIKYWPWKYNGIDIMFIDTPGFNDTNKSEGEILRDLSNWLMKSCQNNAKLSGIIYLHRISDNRMEGAALRNLQVFQALCGDNSLQHVILVTTHWVGVPKATAEAREKELVETYWKDMTERGSEVRRFEGTKSSAIKLISEFLDRKLGETTLQIQREMVEEKKNLADTSAGKVVSKEMLKIKAKYEKDRKELMESMEEALMEKDEEYYSILNDEKKKVIAEIERIRKGEEAIKLELREQQKAFEEQQKAFDEQQQRLDTQRQQVEQQLLQQLLLMQRQEQQQMEQPEQQQMQQPEQPQMEQLQQQQMQQPEHPQMEQQLLQQLLLMLRQEQQQMQQLEQQPMRQLEQQQMQQPEQPQMEQLQQQQMQQPEQQQMQQLEHPQMQQPEQQQLQQLEQQQLQQQGGNGSCGNSSSGWSNNASGMN